MIYRDTSVYWTIINYDSLYIQIQLVKGSTAWNFKTPRIKVYCTVINYDSLYIQIQSVKGSFAWDFKTPRIKALSCYQDVSPESRGINYLYSKHPNESSQVHKIFTHQLCK